MSTTPDKLHAIGTPSVGTPANERTALMASDATLRDHFAAAALTGMCSSNLGDSFAPEQAESAYKIADAMLKARTTPPGTD